MVRTPVVLVDMNQFPFDHFKPAVFMAGEKRRNLHAQEYVTLDLVTRVYVAMDSSFGSQLERWSTTNCEVQATMDRGSSEPWLQTSQRSGFIRGTSLVGSRTREW